MRPSVPVLRAGSRAAVRRAQGPRRDGTRSGGVLAKRMQAELDASRSTGTTAVRVFERDFRNIAERLGGCVVAAMWAEASPVFEFVTKEDWLEWGPAICHRKFSL